jgi:hypothetical protein
VHQVGLPFARQEADVGFIERLHIQNIDHFEGILGSAHGSQIAFGNENVLHSKLLSCGIDLEDRQEFERLVDALKKTTDATERKSLIKRGIEWIAKHAAALGALSGELRAWIEQFSG